MLLLPVEYFADYIVRDYVADRCTYGTADGYSDHTHRERDKYVVHASHLPPHRAKFADCEVQ